VNGAFAFCEIQIQGGNDMEFAIKEQLFKDLEKEIAPILKPHSIEIDWNAHIGYLHFCIEDMVFVVEGPTPRHKKSKIYCVFENIADLEREYSVKEALYVAEAIQTMNELSKQIIEIVDKYIELGL
jgi:hypothetical protein